MPLIPATQTVESVTAQANLTMHWKGGRVGAGGQGVYWNYQGKAMHYPGVEGADQ